MTRNLHTKLDLTVARLHQVTMLLGSCKARRYGAKLAASPLKTSGGRSAKSQEK
jgi:hypothetical protein